MIASDHARTHNPSHRPSTCDGITNVGGFLAGLIAIFLIGAALDLQGAGLPPPTPSTRSGWRSRRCRCGSGLFFIVLERRRTRIHIGWDQPRPKRGARGD